MQTTTIEDLLLHRTASGLVGGPGGVLFQVKSVDQDADDYVSAVWTYDQSHGLRRMTDPAVSSTGAQWSSSGSRIAFLRTVEDRSQIFTMNPDGGEATCLTSFEHGVGSIEHWCEGHGRNGRLLVRATCSKQEKNAPHVIEYLPFKLDGSGITAGQTIGLYEVDDRSGQATLVTDSGDIVEAKWCPRGESIAFVQRRSGTQQHAMDLWIKQPNQQPRRVTTRLVSLSGISWSPDGRYIAASASEAEGSSMHGLYLIAVATAQVQRVGTVEMAVPGTVQWDREGGRLLVLEAYRGLQRISCVTRNGHVTAMVEDDGRQVTDMAAVGAHIFFLAEGIFEGPELWQSGALGEARHQVSEFNAWRNERSKFGYERRSFRVPDGNGADECVEGWLLTPPGEGPFPLLLDMHGGPHSYVMFDFDTHVHWPLLLEQGWAVLAMNQVGSSSYGEKFARRICGRWGELDLPQWTAAVEHLRSDGIANGQLAAVGHSYGGFVSAWALCPDMPLVCGIVSAGVLDQQSHAGTSDNGYYVAPYSVGCELHAGNDLYRRLSPLTYAGDVTTPTLLLQGQDDQRCPVGQAEEFFAALVRAGKAHAKMVLFPGGSHHLSSTGRPSHRICYYRHIVQWLDAHLQQGTEKDTNKESAPELSLRSGRRNAGDRNYPKGARQTANREAAN